MDKTDKYKEEMLHEIPGMPTIAASSVASIAVMPKLFYREIQSLWCGLQEFLSGFFCSSSSVIVLTLNLLLKDPNLNVKPMNIGMIFFMSLQTC